MLVACITVSSDENEVADAMLGQNEIGAHRSHIVSLEDRVLADHLLRRITAVAIDRCILVDPVLIPNNDYIYCYVVPGDTSGHVYGCNTYYGQKGISKSQSGERCTCSQFPHVAIEAAPRPVDFPDLEFIFHVITELFCTLYDNAFMPILLANKLVSLFDFPSQRILSTFACQEIV